MSTNNNTQYTNQSSSGRQTSVPSHAQGSTTATTTGGASSAVSASTMNSSAKQKEHLDRYFQRHQDATVATAGLPTFHPQAGVRHGSQKEKEE
ncbi:hypothetical protein CI109_107255 [Kwoniella shandongensis]|uniref:Uncharacterized protein n=1 Tax=Kwoniella shandongensis TaxID=1734106 RepID=A0A5M6C247_9TREE|nr:uncharacterized protein CI109_002538 [Kwoniella shandongensis]KAA5529197.1 hypothetical protein CI109_002538 [Kwoniella shandongensis]